MANFSLQVASADAEELRAILRTYAPRLTFSEERAGGWFSDSKRFTVQGDEPYLSQASNEVEAWQEQVMLRKAW